MAEGPASPADAAGEQVLRGRRVLVLRPEAQADDLAWALEELGATPVVVPAIRIEPLDDWSAVDRALDRILAAARYGILGGARDSTFGRTREGTLGRALNGAGYDWVLFTSVNGVAAVTGRMVERGLEPGVLGVGGGRVGAIGPATQRALERAGIAVDWVPSRFTTQALAGELPAVAPASPGRSARFGSSRKSRSSGKSGSPASSGGSGSGAGSVCIFRADVAGPELDDALAARGFEVERVDAYCTVPAGGGQIAAALASGVDAVAFTSASIVRAFAEACSEEPWGRRWEGTGGSPAPLVCCIGPATAQACAAAGLRIDCEATEHTIPGLVRAIAGRLDRLPPAAGAR